MSTDSTPSSLALARTQAAGPAQRSFSAPPAGERQQIAELAREFESFFILQMVRQMRRSMLDDEAGQGLGANTMTDTLDVELGRQLAASGGIGLAQILQTALERQVGTSTAAKEAPEASVGAARLERRATRGDSRLPTLVGPGSPLSHDARVGAVSPEPASRAWPAEVGGPAAPAMPLPVGAPLSSPFGWRSDPFHGATRFHQGVDIAEAYGREVPAAGTGHVVFAGEQGGYGHTVVIEHAGGIRTRYAHLSSLQVEAGQQVGEGTIVGRVGTSGRSTGPHLHFEVLQDGKPVDPERAAARYAGQLKFGGVVAD
jgi:murein DD-endopeptidase MepM/ murein hydrolase activator NlpD